MRLSALLLISCSLGLASCVDDPASNGPDSVPIPVLQVGHVAIPVPPGQEPIGRDCSPVRAYAEVMVLAILPYDDLVSVGPVGAADVSFNVSARCLRPVN